MAEAARSMEQQNESAGRGGSIEDIALIEEQVDSGLAALLENYEPRYRFDRLPVDSIPERFTLHLGQPLPELDSAGAKAYSATCHYLKDRAIYALVLNSRIPYRMAEIEAMKSVQNSHLLTLHEAAPIRLSQPSEVRMVLFLDRPKGQTLAELLASGRTFTEQYIVRSILAPLCEGLLALKEQNIHHGRINLDSLYLDEKLVIAECLSEPCGVRQHVLYEPIERALADPSGKGTATSKSDAYSVGMLAYDLLYGLQKFREVDAVTFTRYILEVGCYHLLIAKSNKEPSEAMTDFFRGLLCENMHERWGLEHINNWLGGKRYNLIHPSLPNESTRPFTFAETDYFNCRALANAIHRNWARASKDIRQHKLDRWLETSAHRADTADRVERIIRSTGGESTNNPKLNNELASRIILSLDPTGPIRLDRVSVTVEGVGTAISHYLRHGMQQEIGQLNEIIDIDLINYAADVGNHDEKSPGSTNITWKLQSLRPQVKLTSLGFGMERAMYSLNSGLPCQSDLLLPYHVISIEDALNVLDSLSVRMARETSLMDRHLSAFLASKCEMAKEVKFPQLSRFPALRDNPELKTLRILSMAQEKIGRPKLPGLTAWAAMRVERLSDNIHNRRSRKQLKQSLKSAANTGYISYVLATLVESDITKDDYTGFATASMLYARNNQKIDALANPKTVQEMSKDLGARIAVFIAYLVLSITSYILLDQYYIGL